MQRKRAPSPKRLCRTPHWTPPPYGWRNSVIIIGVEYGHRSINGLGSKHAKEGEDFTSIGLSLGSLESLPDKTKETCSASSDLTDLLDMPVPQSNLVEVVLVLRWALFSWNCTSYCLKDIKRT